jgi:RHS repeat-associated protein
MMYYDAANQLRVTEARRTDPPSLGTAALRLIERDESRYDALGRRVLVSSRRRCYDNNEPQAAVCLQAYVQRTVWAGAQEIYEDRVPLDTAYHTPHVVSGDRTWSQVPELPVREFPGFRFDPNPYFGAVAYAYGEALDQPLMVVRAGYRDRWTAYGPTLTDPVYAPSAFTIFPHWSPQGYANLGTGRDGGQFHCSGGDCTFAIAWGMSWSPYNPTFGRRAAWIGSLLEDKKDANGLLYRRNRYVDPQTGRFTQQDPIGIAGGLNLYGFASGDPVNRVDPFGLMDDITYDKYGKETRRVETKEPDRYYLEFEGQTYRLDYGLKESSVPYQIVADESSFDAQASALARQGAPVFTTWLSIAYQSLPGKSLDFKRLLPDRSLWNVGGGLMTHKHAVGNAAWGKYMQLRGYSLSVALRGAALQGASVGGEDHLDQRMIRRGYQLP